ncbi:MAG TPA: phage holin family protein [Kofleriaceae bacterium]|nr:phage holin family protein [Kofleriaceae bacterium]
MELQRTSSRLAPARVEPGTNGHGEESLAGLATRLAQQGLELASVELRRLGGEVRERRRHAVRAAVALYLVRLFAAVGIAALASGSVLYLGRLWGSYGAASLATGGVLIAAAIVAGMVLSSAAHRMVDSADDSEAAGAADERI